MDAATAKPFTAEDFRLRAARAGPEAAGEAHGDHALNPDLAELILGQKLRDAAVLVPVVGHSAGATVILTKRTETLRAHSGQIAFPGGAIDADDGSPEAAALREAEEEIGLGAEEVDVVGRMPDYTTGSGYRIAPVLGVLRPGFRLRINPDEVDAAFEVPLAFLMDPANHRRESRIWNERERHYYTMPFGDRYIWGVTAGIIRALYERLYA